MGKANPSAVAKTKSKNDSKAWSVIKTICKYIYKFRGVIISIPVVVIAIILGFMNAGRLPETVGLELLATGEFGMSVSRITAVLAPMGITGLAVLMTLLSKRTLFPWLISVFTLVLPVLIWLTNIYPA